MPILGIIASSTQQGLVTGSFESIATANPSGTSTATFTSIPATFQHLRLHFVLTSTNSTQLQIRANNDSGSTSYTWHAGIGGWNTPPQTDTQWAERGDIPLCLINSPSSTIPAMGIIDIFDYKNTNKFKPFRIMSGIPNSTALVISGIFRSTNAITRLDLYNNSGGNLTTNSRVALYGMKGA